MKNLECGGKFETARNAQDPDESRHGDPPRAKRREGMKV